MLSFAFDDATRRRRRREITAHSRRMGRGWVMRLRIFRNACECVCVCVTCWCLTMFSFHLFCPRFIPNFFSFFLHFPIYFSTGSRKTRSARVCGGSW
jgi:hypothetical protein